MTREQGKAPTELGTSKRYTRTHTHMSTVREVDMQKGRETAGKRKMKRAMENQDSKYDRGIGEDSRDDR